MGSPGCWGESGGGRTERGGAGAGCDCSSEGEGGENKAETCLFTKYIFKHVKSGIGYRQTQASLKRKRRSIPALHEPPNSVNPTGSSPGRLQATSPSHAPASPSPGQRPRASGGDTRPWTDGGTKAGAEPGWPGWEGAPAAGRKGGKRRKKEGEEGGRADRRQPGRTRSPAPVHSGTDRQVPPRQSHLSTDTQSPQGAAYTKSKIPVYKREQRKPHPGASSQAQCNIQTDSTRAQFTLLTPPPPPSEGEKSGERG